MPVALTRPHPRGRLDQSAQHALGPKMNRLLLAGYGSFGRGMLMRKPWGDDLL